MLLRADSSLVAIPATLVLLAGMNGPHLFQIIIFLLSIIVSCVGLYFLTLEGFDIKQYDVVCEFFYSTIGFLEWMSYFATQLGPWRVIKAPLPLGIYHIISIVGSDLGWQVEVSATAALFAGVCFGAFMYMYHLH
jgi:hypothetical protein